MSLSLILICVIIFVIVIIVPLFFSKKAKDNSKINSEWDKIREYGKKLNEKSRNNKN